MVQGVWKNVKGMCEVYMYMYVLKIVERVYMYVRR